MPDSQNFNTVTGISTFNKLNIANNLSVGASITAGTMAYFGGEVGIGTTNNAGYLQSSGRSSADISGHKQVIIQQVKSSSLIRLMVQYTLMEEIFQVTLDLLFPQ